MPKTYLKIPSLQLGYNGADECFGCKKPGCPELTCSRCNVSLCYNPSPEEMEELDAEFGALDPQMCSVCHVCHR